MESSKRPNSERTEEALHDLGTAAREGEEMLRSTAGELGEKGRELRARLQAAIDRAKALYDRMEEKTVAAAKATDKAVHEHPYEALGLAFGVGLLIGVLAMRSRRD
jgi:ElaB/YqjD/DUF883 family membrane-anchored ribosome-binding protein